MNIKEHIDAGHFPVDAKGRALVPLLMGGLFTVVTTLKPGDSPIIGWDNNGWVGAFAADDPALMTPSPLKVPIKCWGVLAVAPGEPPRILHVHASREAAEGVRFLGQTVVELTGEGVQPW